MLLSVSVGACFQETQQTCLQVHLEYTPPNQKPPRVRSLRKVSGETLLLSAYEFGWVEGGGACAHAPVCTCMHACVHLCTYKHALICASESTLRAFYVSACFFCGGRHLPEILHCCLVQTQSYAFCITTLISHVHFPDGGIQLQTRGPAC